jgi:3'(2'), 5'-bisphosphate nucleotidase
MDLDKLLNIALETAQKAGVEVMKYYQQGNYTAQFKADNSPVTSADIAANDIIMAQLKTLTPTIPIISEEVGSVDIQQRKNWPRYWLLDPIDGTGEFILGSGDFAVNIALIDNGWPSIGVIHAPDHKITYYAHSNVGAYKDNALTSKQIKVAEYDQSRKITVAISRRQELHLMGQYLSPNFTYEHISLGSCSLKNCLIAEGLADCYLRIGPTGEWDTGASHCIVEQAGGSIVDSEFKPLTYNQRQSLMNPDFITLGNKEFPWKQIILSHRTQRNY